MIMRNNNMYMLSMNISRFLQWLKGKKVQFHFPQFNRENEEVIVYFPKTKKEYQDLKNLSHEELTNFGCRAFGTFKKRNKKEDLKNKNKLVVKGSIYESLDNELYDELYDEEKTKYKGAKYVLWLFPAEWYEHIPKGLKIVDINGVVENFEPNKTDDDRRFGCLAYGFLQKKEK